MENPANTTNGEEPRAGKGEPLPQQLANTVLEVLLRAVRHYLYLRIACEMAILIINLTASVINYNASSQVPLM